MDGLNSRPKRIYEKIKVKVKEKINQLEDRLVENIQMKAQSQKGKIGK